MRQFVLLAVLVLLSPAFASNPGEPLDASDWVLLEPGLSIATDVPYPCEIAGTNNPLPACTIIGGTNLLLDGDVLFSRKVQLTFNDECGCGQNQARVEIVRLRPDGTESVIAQVTTRCNLNVAEFIDDISIAAPLFDAIRGRITFTTSVVGRNLQTCGPVFYNGYSKLHIDGLTTLFDVLQTFTPTASTLSFRVPYMPDGFQFADWFDTYTGDLATVGNWSQAQPLQCGYPATAPSVGDYLTVADTLPDPAPGQGRYYLTATQFMGQTRLGRKKTSAVMSGRNPALLPVCQ